MKILLSAYACEPNKGSEPGVGWHWAVELTKLGHDVWVLTRANNQQGIDKEYLTNQQPGNLHFLYYDLPSWVRRWKKGNRWVHLYYLLWQWRAYSVAKGIHAKEKFDLVHHVTFVSVRQPSFMGNLGIPFIFGPVAGGESAPWRLRFHYGVRGFCKDAIRDVVNLFVRFDPLMWRTFNQAQKIYVTSEQTKKLLPPRFRQKAKVQLAIGLDSNEMVEPVDRTKQAGLRILYVGHFLYLKGMGLGLRAFARLAQKVPQARLTMVGEGPDEKRWRKLARELNIADQVDWIPWVDRKGLSEIYERHDLFLFPSLHDSGGMVILEAMSHGLPVVCLDLGGPGVIANDSCSIKVNAMGKTEQQVIEDLSFELIRLARDFLFLRELSIGAIKRVDNLNWEKLVSKIYRMPQAFSGW